jgi:hypothetical protein
VKPWGLQSVKRKALPWAWMSASQTASRLGQPKVQPWASRLVQEWGPPWVWQRAQRSVLRWEQRLETLMAPHLVPR